MMHALAVVLLIAMNQSFQTAAPAPAATADSCTRDASPMQVVSPGFPRAAANRYRRGTSKIARVRVTVGTNGRTVAASIFQSSGDAELDMAALRAAQLYTFAPRLIACVPVPGDYLLQFDFVRN